MSTMCWLITVLRFRCAYWMTKTRCLYVLRCGFRSKIRSESTNARLREDNAPHIERSLYWQQVDISTASDHEAISKERYVQTINLILIICHFIYLFCLLPTAITTSILIRDGVIATYERVLVSLGFIPTARLRLCLDAIDYFSKNS